MKTRLTTRLLPEPFRTPVREMCSRIRKRYPRTAAFIVIGSVADGTWQDDSDVDLVWVFRGRLRRRWHDELDYRYDGPVELVHFNLTQVGKHFRQCSPMAHAIQQGIVLWDPEGLHDRWRRRRLGPPTAQWIAETYDFMSRRFEWGLDSYRRARRLHRKLGHESEDCVCEVSEILTRAALNLVRLLLVLRGFVPLSKAHTRALYPRLLRGPRLRAAMELTLTAHHEKRDLTLSEAREVAYLGEWARKRLLAELGLPASAEQVEAARKPLRR